MAGKESEFICEGIYEPATYEARFLIGFQQIGRAFGHSANLARQWEKEGAPIFRADNNIPRAEKMEMWNWYKNRCAEK